jgi:cysteine synthase A
LIAAREFRDRHHIENVVTFFCDKGEKYITDYWL